MNKLILILTSGLLIAISSLSPAQVLSAEALANEYASISRKYTKLISVGSSINEVKAILGKPIAVQSGFPDTDDSFAPEMPEFHGQLNYTSFIYRLPNIFTRTWKSEEGGGAVVDGFTLTEKEWLVYDKQDTIWFEGQKKHCVRVQYPSGSKPDLEVAELSSISPLTIGKQVHVTLMANGRFALGNPEPTGTNGVILAIFDSTHITGVARSIGWAGLIGKHKNQCNILRTPIKFIHHKVNYIPMIFVLIDKGTAVVAAVKTIFVGI